MEQKSTELNAADYLLDKQKFLFLQNKDNPKKMKDSRLRFDEETKAGKVINGCMDDIYKEIDVSVYSYLKL